MVIEMPVPNTKEPASTILDTIRSLQKKIAEGKEAAEILSVIVVACQNGSPPPSIPAKVFVFEDMTDRELAEATGLRVTKKARPDLWRQYLALRKQGTSFWDACGRLHLWRDTAKKLDALL